jgi:hypothetical protein
MKEHSLKDILTYPSDSKLTVGLFSISVVSLIASVIGYFIIEDKAQFYFSYLTSFAYVASIALAALFFVMLQHVTRSKWSAVLRRLPESVASNLWILLFLFIPVVLGMHDLFHWTHEDAVAADKLLQDKAPYLNIPFFIGRNIVYILVWAFLGHRLLKLSRKMDESGDWGIQTLMRKISAPGILFFGFSVAFASFDWLMSLDPHWFSTMFGVYYFAMSFQVFFPVMILLIFHLHKKGLLTQTIKKTHLQDLGKLFFGFTVFYAYIAFSQFLLIYYANIPEEVLWFSHRMEGSWIYISFTLLIGRFVLPFILLLGMKAKSNFTLLKIVSVLILIIHFIELYWIVMPTFSHHGFHFHILDFTTLIGLGTLFLGALFVTLKKGNLVPVNDPYLSDSLHKH